MKVKGIKKAITTKRNWEERDYFYRTNIMFDLSDGEVWTDTFTSCNSYINYHSNTIMSITNILCERELKTNMANVKLICSELLGGTN